MKEAIRGVAPAGLVGLLVLTVLAPPALALQQLQTVAVPEEARTAPLDLLIPPSPAVSLGELPNGLRYYIRSNQEPGNRAELRLVVRVGSIVEDDDQLGLAHFVEHMAFNGTENFEEQQLVQFMESIGMRFGAGVNASTGFDETTYRLTVPTDDPRYMATAFQILEDWAHGMTLDPEEIDQERDVIVEEWRFRRGVQARVQDAQYPVIFQGSRYAERLPIGTIENIETFEHESLRRFYREWYRPDLMAVIAIGDFDRLEVEALLTDHFGDWPPPEGTRERVAYSVPDHEETLYSIVTDPELTTSSVSVYHKMDANHDWTVGGYRQTIVEGLYNSLLNDRFAEVTRQPEAPFLGASGSQGMFVRTEKIYSLSATVPEGGVERGLAALFEEAERVERFGFTETELERAKTNILRQIEQIYTNRVNTPSGSFAAEYTRALLDGEAIPGIEYEWELYQRFVPEITLDEVNRVGQSWITDSNRVVLVSGPEGAQSDLPDETELTAVLEGVQTAEITPYVDRVAAETLLDDVPTGSPVVETRELEREITEWRLANGILVALKSTDFEEDEVVFRAYSTGGTSLASDEDFVPAMTAAQLITAGGVADFDAIALDRLLAGTVASASPFITDFEEGVSGGASIRDLETLFQLIYLRLTEPRMDEQYYQVWLNRARESLANRDADPNTAFNDAYVRIITQDHPRERPVTVATLDQTDLAESFAFYQERFADTDDFTFVFVGNIDFDVMRPLVERYLGALPATDRDETWRDVGVRPPRGVVEETVERGLEPISQTVVTFTGPFDYGDQVARAAIRALAMTLDTRLNSEIREVLGGTYSIGVGPGLSWRPEEAYQFSIGFGSDPERTEELLDAIFEALETIKATGPTESETADAREALLRQFETDFSSNRTWLNQLVADYQRGVPPGSAVDTFGATVNGLTPADVQEMARRVLDTENYFRVTLMPE